MKIVRFLLPTALLLTVALQVGGCASAPLKPPALRVPDIIEMSREGVPPRQIIARMQESGTVYRMDAARLAKLRAKGVPDPVINYMQDTYLQSVRHRQELRDDRNWRYEDDWWYGGRPYGWRDEWIVHGPPRW